MNVGSNIFKSTGLATLVFWIFLFKEINSDSFIPLITLSTIPIFLCCLVTILFTILPFYWIGDGSKSSKQAVFKRFFPYYTIASFTISACFIIANNFSIYITSFFVSAFITTCQSWVWFSKD